MESNIGHSFVKQVSLHLTPNDRQENLTAPNFWKHSKDYTKMLFIIYRKINTVFFYPKLILEIKKYKANIHEQPQKGVGNYDCVLILTRWLIVEYSIEDHLFV